jgi:acylphosphatase
MAAKPGKPIVARRWFVSGRVQGVGFRYFVERAAEQLSLRGYVRNLDDGRVEVYAVGPQETLSQLAGMLRVGPRWADVRRVEEQEAEVERHLSFHIE